MNKKIFSITVVGIATLSFLFFTGISSAQATVTFQGDLPDDGINYRVEAYTAAQGSPCDAAADAGLMFFSTVWGPGDSSYDDNNDYVSGAFTATSTPAHIYLCRSGDAAGTSRVYFTHAIVDGNAYELDFGYITGTADVHDDLGSKYVHVCDALTGGNELSSVNAATAVDGSYSQYYYMWQGTVAADGGNIDNVYMFIDDDTASKCTFDATKKAGLYIDPDNVTPYNYGIYITDYSPGNKVSAASNLHDDINGWIRVKSNAIGDPNIGLTGLIAAETYTLYYDAPASDKKITAEAFKTAVDTAADVAMTVSNIDYNFSVLSFFRKISGNTPSDVSYVQTTLTVVNTGTGVVFRTTTDSSSPNIYTLYIPDAQTPTVIFQDSGSIGLFSYLYAGAVGADDVLYINKLAGSVHADLGASDTIQVFEVNDCTGTTNTKAVAVNPSGGGGTYVAYFADLGDDVDVTEDYYVKITNGSYTTCGAIFQVPLARERTDVNFDIKVDGTVHTDIDRVGVDDDAATSNSTSADTCSAYGNVSVGIYTMFVTDDTLGGTTGGGVDVASNVFFPTVALPATELLETTKDLTSDKTVNAAKVSGSDANIHADLLNDGGLATNDLIMVTVASANGTGVDLASIAGVIDASDDAATTTESYICYFEVPSDGLVNFEIQDGDASNAVLAYAYNFSSTGAGDYTFEPFSIITATFPATVLGFEVQQGDSGGYNMRDNTSTYIIYVDKTEEIADPLYDYRAYTDTAFTALVLDRSSKDVSGAATWGVNTVTNTAIHADVTGDTDPVDVYTSAAGTAADCTTTLLSSDTTQVWAAGSKKYYETNAVTNINLKITEVGTGAVSCVNTLISAAAAGGDDAYSIDKKTSGNVNPDVITVKIDADQDASEDISQAAVVGTPSTYAIYWKGDGVADISFYNGTPTLVLDRTGKNLSADATVNVAKASGASQEALATLVVYTDAACSTAVSSETVNPTTTYSQYFEGIDATTYRIAVTDATPHSSCLTTGFTPSFQAATVNFDRKLSGSVPDVSSTTIDILSVTADTGDDTYWVNTVDPGASTPNTYAIYVDADDSAIATTGVAFIDTAGGTGTSLISTTKNLTSDGTVNASVAYGNSHASIQGAGEVDTVCYGTLPTSNGDCSTQAGVVTSPAAAATYEIFFEQVSAVTTYYLQIADLDTETYYSWNKFTSATAGARTSVEVDGKLDGIVAEAWDTPTTRVPDVTIKMYTDAGDPDTNQISLTYSYTGTATPGGNYRMYGDLGVTYDAQYVKASYITQSAVGVPGLDDTVNVDLVSGLKIIVKYNADQQLVEGATVSLYECSDATTCSQTTMDQCTHPSGNCTIAGDNTSGNGSSGEYYFTGMTVADYVQVKVEKTGFDTVWSPDPVALGTTDTAYAVSDTGQVSMTIFLSNPGPQCSAALVGGSGTYSSAEGIYADVGQNVILDVNCGETGLTVTADLSNIDGSASQALTDNADGTYSYTQAVGSVATGSKSITVTANDGSNTDTDIVNVIVDNTVPGTVSAVTDPGAVSLDGAVTWDWTAASDANSGVKNYEVKIATSSDCSSGVLVTDYTPLLSYSRAGLVDGSTYYACVKARDNVGNEGTAVNSDGIKIDVTAIDTVTLSLPIPEGYFTAVTGTVYWYDVAGETGYTVEVADDTSMETNLVSATFAADITSATVGAGQAVNKTLTDGVSYYWRVRADDSAGASAKYSEVRVFTVDATVPTLDTPSPADDATGQTNAITLGITAGGNETGLDCRYNFAATKVAADIGWASMYIMVDNNDGTYRGGYDYLSDGTWFANIKCQDIAGNEAEFGDSAGADYSFTVGSEPTEISVDISATKSWATADDDYDNGWAWEFDVTVPTAETSLQMKFANWVSGSNNIAVANNMRFYSSQAQTAVSQGTAIDVTVAETYSSAMTLTGDRDSSKGGRQVQITVEAKVPAGSSGGSYSTRYGIQSL